MPIIRTFFNIIVLKAKSHELPFNTNFTSMAFIAACLTTSLSASLHPLIDQAVIFGIVKTITVSALVSLFLIAAQKKARTAQTLLALLGTAAILQLAVYLFSVLNINILAFVVSIWAFVMQTVIIKHALDTGKIQAFFISLGVEMSIVFSLFLVFPDQMQSMITEIQQAQTSNYIKK